MKQIEFVFRNLLSAEIKYITRERRFIFTQKRKFQINCAKFI